MPETPPPAAIHLKSLTSLRFVAALAVVLFHLFSLAPSDLTPRPVPGAGATIAATTDSADANRQETFQIGPVRSAITTALPFLSAGHLAVDFFFVLSGFVLAHVYMESCRSRTFRYGRFLQKRFARIYPLHLVTLAAFVVLTVVSIRLGLGPNDAAAFDFRTLPQHLLMVHSWGTIERLTFNGPSWSISAEWAAYLAFPLVIWGLLRMKAAIAVGLSVVWFLALNEFASTPDHPLTSRSADWGILRIAAEFPLGVALLLLSRESWAAKRWVGKWSVSAGVVVALVSASLGAVPGVTVLALAAIVFGAAVWEAHGGLQGLTHRSLVYGGEISYSIYMVHGLVQVVCTQLARRAGWTDGTLGFDLVMVAAVFATLLAAHLSYRLIEMPAQRLLTCGFAKRSKSLTASHAAPASTLP